jgi:hypothetical protein
VWLALTNPVGHLEILPRLALVDLAGEVAGEDVEDRQRCKASHRAQTDLAANHPAQHVPVFVPRMARTAISQRFDMPNSMLSHNAAAGC